MLIQPLNDDSVVTPRCLPPMKKGRPEGRPFPYSTA